MPIYRYVCAECGEVMDVERPYEKRNEPEACNGCHLGWGEYQISAPRIGTERKRGDARLITDERELAPRWRDEGTTGKEGGAGRVLTFDQGAKH